MQADTQAMVQFFENLGHRVFQSASSWWYEVQPGVLMSCPYHELISPPREELQELMDRNRLKALRFPTPLEGYGVLNHLELNTDPGYSLEKLEREARRQTRRGLEQCRLEQIDFEFLQRHGLELNRATAQRQGRDMIYTDEKYWARYCQAVRQTAGATAWGVMVEGRLGTYLVAVEQGGWWNWLLTNSSTELLKMRTSNVLFYQATRSYFDTHPDHKICYGLGSLEEVSNLDHFKVSMGVEMRPIKQRLVFSRKIETAFKLTPDWALAFMNRLFPRNYTVRKASAMIRLYHNQTRELPGECSGNDRPDRSVNESDDKKI